MYKSVGNQLEICFKSASSHAPEPRAGGALGAAPRAGRRLPGRGHVGGLRGTLQATGESFKT